MAQHYRAKICRMTSRRRHSGISHVKYVDKIMSTPPQRATNSHGVRYGEFAVFDQRRRPMLVKTRSSADAERLRDAPQIRTNQS